MVNSIDVSKAHEKPKVSLEEMLAKYESAIRSQQYGNTGEVKTRIAKIERDFMERYLESYSESGNEYREQLEKQATTILKS